MGILNKTRILHIGDAFIYIGIGIIVGLYLADSEFHASFLVVALILAGCCIRIWAKGNDSPAYRDSIAHWTMIAILALIILFCVAGLIMSAIETV